MYRIDNSTALSTIPAPRAVGPVANGFFTNGDFVAQIPATDVDDDWLNAVQEELIAVLVAGGLTPSKTNRAQVIAAIEILVAAETTRAETTETTIAQTVANEISRAQAAELSIRTTHGEVQFLASGNFTVPPNVYRVFVRIWGAGGCGGNGAGNVYPGGGGGGGGYAEGWIAVTPGQVIPVTVGAGTGVPESSGGASSFQDGTVNPFATGGGGGGEGTTAVGNGGGGGVGVGGTTNITGGTGSTGIVYANPGANEGGNGGPAFCGPGPVRAVGGTASGIAGNGGTFPGGGSTGGTTSVAASANGLVLVIW